MICHKGEITVAKYERSKKRIDPEEYGYPSNIPDELNLPTGVIAGLFDIKFKNHFSGMVESLRGKFKREGFSQHAYFCLPLSIANQTGFIIRSPFEFRVEWNGGSELSDTKIEKIEATHDDEQSSKVLHVDSHFGDGIVTVNVPIQFRTPFGVNIYIGQPPNYFVDGLSWMAAMVETDQLRRNFTFNIKITRPNHQITIKPGQPIAWMMPYPRYFFDSFEYQEMDEVQASREEIDNELSVEKLFAIERQEIDSQVAGQNGYRYLDGLDIFDNVFPDHQTKILDPMAARELLSSRSQKP